MILINKRVLPRDVFKYLPPTCFVANNYPDLIVLVQGNLRRPLGYVTLYQFNFVWG